MTDRITRRKIERMLALYCDVAGLTCAHLESGEYMPGDDRAGAYHIDHSPYGGYRVHVFSEGGGERDAHEFTSERQPARQLYGQIRAAWLAISELQRRNGVGS